MRLIDANALLAEYDRQHEGDPGKARKLIEDAPTINRPTRSQFKRMAAQLGYELVVHCKDCKYWQDNNDGYPHEECRWGHGETPDANDFCIYGERRTDEQ